jgi:hypothetical protein
VVGPLYPRRTRSANAGSFSPFAEESSHRLDGELTTAALLEKLPSVQLAELSYQTSDGSPLCFERASVPSAA